MDEMLTKRAVQCKQNNRIFFAFSLSMDEIVRIAYVSRRSEDRGAGYQRILDPKRAESIKRYVEAGGVLPSSILLNFDSEDYLRYDDAAGTVTFSASAPIAWIIDGQHRVYGADLLIKSQALFATPEDFQFLVCAFAGLELVEQARLFIDINSYQQGVDKSLLYDLLEYFSEDDDTKEAFYTSRASDIARSLTRDPESPFYGRISLTSDRVLGQISLGTFVDALIPHLRPGGIISHTNEYKFALEDQRGVIRNYFNAVRQTLPHLWFDDKSIVTKTTGFNALMLVLPTIFTKTIEKYSDFKIEHIVQVIKPVQGIPWTGRVYSGQQGTVASKRLAERIRTSILEAIEQTVGAETGKRLQL